MEYIGDVRWRWFTAEESDWNGMVRQITAEMERPGELVDAEKVATFLAEHYRAKAHWARFQMSLSEPK